MLRIDRRITAPIAALLVLASAVARGGDWPSWRGPSQDGVSLEKGLPDSTKQLLWQAHYGGRSAPAIFGGRVFGIDLAGEGVMEQDRVFALDLASGKTVWEYGFNVFHTDVPDTRVGWANVAVDAETGQPLWHFNTGQSFKASPMTYAVDGVQYVAVCAGSDVFSFALPH